MRVFNFIFYFIPPKNDKCGKKKQPFQDEQHVRNDATSADKQRTVTISTTKSRTKQRCSFSSSYWTNSFRLYSFACVGQHQPCHHNLCTLENARPSSLRFGWYQFSHNIYISSGKCRLCSKATQSC